MKRVIQCIGIIVAISLFGSASAAIVTVANLNDSGPGSFLKAVVDASRGDTRSFGVNGIVLLTRGQIQFDQPLYESVEMLSLEQALQGALPVRRRTSKFTSSSKESVTGLRQPFKILSVCCRSAEETTNCIRLCCGECAFIYQRSLDSAR